MHVVDSFNSLFRGKEERKKQFGIEITEKGESSSKRDRTITFDDRAHHVSPHQEDGGKPQKTSLPPFPENGSPGPSTATGKMLYHPVHTTMPNNGETTRRNSDGSSRESLHVEGSAAYNQFGGLSMSAPNNMNGILEDHNTSTSSKRNRSFGHVSSGVVHADSLSCDTGPNVGDRSRIQSNGLVDTNPKEKSPVRLSKGTQATRAEKTDVNGSAQIQDPAYKDSGLSITASGHQGTEDSNLASIPNRQSKYSRTKSEPYINKDTATKPRLPGAEVKSTTQPLRNSDGAFSNTKTEMDGRADPREFHRVGPRTGSTAYPGVDPKPDPRMDVRVAQVQAAPKVDLRTTNPKADLKVDPGADPKVAPKVEPKIEPKVEPKVDPRVDPRVDARVDPRVDARADPKANKVDPKADPKAHPKVDLRADSKVDAKVVDPRAYPQADHRDPKEKLRTDSNTEPRAKPKRINSETNSRESEVNVEPRSDSKSISRSNSRANSRSDSIADSRTDSREPRVDIRTDHKTDTKANPRADIKTDHKMDLKPETKPPPRTMSRTNSKTHNPGVGETTSGPVPVESNVALRTIPRADQSSLSPSNTLQGSVTATRRNLTLGPNVEKGDLINGANQDHELVKKPTPAARARLGRENSSDFNINGNLDALSNPSVSGMDTTPTPLDPEGVPEMAAWNSSAPNRLAKSHASPNQPQTSPLSSKATKLGMKPLLPSDAIQEIDSDQSPPNNTNLNVYDNSPPDTSYDHTHGSPVEPTYARGPLDLRIGSYDTAISPLATGSNMVFGSNYQSFTSLSAPASSPLDDVDQDEMDSYIRKMKNNSKRNQRVDDNGMRYLQLQLAKTGT